MQTTIKDLIIEVKDYLLAPRQIVIDTNLLMIVGFAVCLIYMLYATIRYINSAAVKTNQKNQHMKIRNGDKRKWYPNGWYWDEKANCWKGPDYPEK